MKKLQLALSADERAAWREELEGLLRASDPAQEYRFKAIVGPEHWTLYFKLRTGASRLAASHPAPAQWVGSLMLSRTHIERLLEALQKGQGDKIAVHQLAELAAFSNLELVLL